MNVLFMKQICFRLDETDPSPVKDVKCVKPEESTRDATSDTTEPVTPKETFQEPPKKRQKSEGNSSRASLRKLELKDRKAEMDKIVSPVIPQPGAWGERHRFKPPPQRETQINVDQAVPQFKETNARFQYGNYNRLVASVLTRLKIINQFSLFHLSRLFSLPYSQFYELLFTFVGPQIQVLQIHLFWDFRPQSQ